MLKRHLELIAPSASPEEAAAIVAALERFMQGHRGAAGSLGESCGAGPVAAGCAARRRRANPGRRRPHRPLDKYLKAARL